MSARGVDFTGLAYLAALVVGAFVVYRVVKSGGDVARGVGDAFVAVKNAAGAAAGAAVDAVTPTNPDNIFNTLIGKPLANWLVKGGNPDDASHGGKLLASFTAGDQDDADQGAAMRSLSRRPDLTMTTADIEDAEMGASMAANRGDAFINYSKLSRGVFH